MKEDAIAINYNTLVILSVSIYSSRRKSPYPSYHGIEKIANKDFRKVRDNYSSKLVDV